MSSQQRWKVHKRGDPILFKDRADAGRRLSSALSPFKRQDVIVFALPRGGVAIGVEVASELDAPLDIITVRKVGHPQCTEYAIAAVAEDGDMVTNPPELEQVDAAWFRSEARLQQQEARRQRHAYMGNRTPLAAAGKIAILVDDGLATGLSMLAAIGEVRHLNPQKIIVAIPVAAASAVRTLMASADEVIALQTSENVRSIGSFYTRFDELTDADVVQLIRKVELPCKSWTPS